MSTILMNATNNNNVVDELEVKHNTDWKKWCRLCAKNDPLSNVNVFWKNEQNTTDNTLSTAIGKFFWVNIKDNDGNSTHICLECHQLVTQLIAFTDRVNRVQSMFGVLQTMSGNNNFDANVIRMQFNIVDEDRHHIISHKRDVDLITEMHINVIGSDNMHIQNEEQVETEEIEQEEFVLEELHHDTNEYVVQLPNRTQQVIKSTNLKPQIGQTVQMHTVFKSEIEKTEIVENPDPDTVAIEEECNEVEVTEEISLEQDGTYIADDDKNIDDIDENDLFKVLKFKTANNGEISRQLVDSKTKNVTERKVTNSNNNSAANKRKRGRGRPSKLSDLSDLGMGTKKQKKPNDIGSGVDTTTNEVSFKYECKICERKYKNPTSYRKHLVETHQVQPDIPDFVCEKCNKVLPTEKQLSVHLRTHMTLEEKMDIPCPYCEKKFTKVAVMRQHVRGIHHNEKPYICDECGKGLKTLAALNEHKLVHTNDCPCICEICNKGFKNNARLKVHLDTHTETNYVCNICGMSLNTRRTLKMHMLVHSDNKKYKCDFCGSEFKRSKALKNHLILHTGMRPYKCNFCEKTFSNGSNCRSHKKKAHPQELAEEEAAGKKLEPVSVPKLDELRSGTGVIIDNPRGVKRQGIHSYLRTLILAAEEHNKQIDADGVDDADDVEDTDDCVEIEYQEQDEDCEEIELPIENTRVLSDIAIENCHIEVEDDYDDDDDEDEEEENVEDDEDLEEETERLEEELAEGDEEETVIYEIISEI